MNAQEKALVSELAEIEARLRARIAQPGSKRALPLLGGVTVASPVP